MYQVPNVLIVDDNEDVVRALSRALRRHFAVTRTTSARDALGLIEVGHRYDAIVCDVNLEDMAGSDFYARLLEHCHHQAARVLFLSGAPRPRTAFGEAIRHRFLEKPIGAAELIARVSQITAPMPLAA